jgi:RimJ/RimL family protein N-acetyltransferase
LSRHVAELGLMVAATARRRGVGSALIEEAVKWARGLGIVKLELTVFPHNAPAIALYRKLGFREEGLLRRRYFIDGRYIDAMLMGLDLD